MLSGPHLQDIKRKGIKIIANAGGINTSACVAALEAACKKAGVEGMKIAQVTGDNIMAGGKETAPSDETVRELNGGVGLPKVNVLKILPGTNDLERPDIRDLPMD